MTLRELSKLGVSSDVMRKLMAYSKFGVIGSDIVWRTTFYAKEHGFYPSIPNTRIAGVKGVTPPPYKALLDAFIPQIIAGVSGLPLIKKFEEGFIKYAGSSRSIILPGKDRRAKLLQSFQLQQQSVPAIDDASKRKFLLRASKRLASYIHKYIPKGSIRVWGDRDKIIQRMKKNTNWGMPYLVKGRVVDPVSQDVLEDNVSKYSKLADKIISISNNASWDSVPYEGRSFIALNRTQEGADNTVKNRIVGGDAHACTIIAGSLYPLLDKCRSIPCRQILNGLDALDAQLAYVVRHTKSNLLSADQSAFDNHISPRLMYDYILPIFFGCLNFSQYPELANPVHDYLYHHVFEDPIVTPDGLGMGTHGMSSGVLVVNELDSGELMLLAFYLDEITMHKYNISPVAIQGDDAVFFVDMALEKIPAGFENACRDFNLEANALKQGVDKNSCTFVKRLGTTECEHGYRSKIGSTIGLCNEENAHAWNEYMYEARAGAILSNHYLSDPGIDEFFGNVTYGGKYLIGLDLPNGYYDIVHYAGGISFVSSQLKLDSYSNMRGVSPTTDGAGKLSIADLAIMQWQKVARLSHKPNKLGFNPESVMAEVRSKPKTRTARKNAKRRLHKRMKRIL